MVTTASNTFESGTDGIAVSTANSGGASGTAFDAIYGTGMNFSAAYAYTGAMGAAAASGAYGGGQWNVSSNKISAHMYFKISATGTEDRHLMRAQNGATRLFGIHINAIDKLRVDDAVGTGGVFTFSNALSANTWYRLEIYIVCGSTTSNGTIKVGYYIGNSTTPVETVYLNNAANVGAGATITAFTMGKYTVSNQVIGFDNLAVDTTLSDFIGIPAAAPPTVSTPANQNVAAGASTTVGVTASSASGTITSYAWSYVYPASGGPTLSNASTANVSFTAGAAGSLYILQCVVTDSNSQTTTVSSEVRVPTPGDASHLSGSAAAATGSWSNVGGAATPGDALSDATDSTYVESVSLSATAVSVRYRLQPMTARSALSLVERFQLDVAGTVTSKVRLYEGTTLRQEWTVTTTTAWVENTYPVTSPGAITDWGNLFVELYATSP